MRNPTKKRISSSSSCSEQSVDLSDDPDTRYNLIKLMRTNKAVLLTVGTALRCINSVLFLRLMSLVMSLFLTILKGKATFRSDEQTYELK